MHHALSSGFHVGYPNGPAYGPGTAYALITGAEHSAAPTHPDLQGDLPHTPVPGNCGRVHRGGDDRGEHTLRTLLKTSFGQLWAAKVATRPQWHVFGSMVRTSTMVSRQHDCLFLVGVKVKGQTPLNQHRSHSACGGRMVGKARVTSGTMQRTRRDSDVARQHLC